jgi:hypothetical protein
MWSWCVSALSAYNDRHPHCMLPDRRDELCLITDSQKVLSPQSRCTHTVTTYTEAKIDRTNAPPHGLRIGRAVWHSVAQHFENAAHRNAKFPGRPNPRPVGGASSSLSCPCCIRSWCVCLHSGELQRGTSLIIRLTDGPLHASRPMGIIVAQH